MIQSVRERVWAFDLEWVPDPLAGRLLYDVPDTVTDPREVLERMWRAGGADADDPTPFLKTVLCRIVSIAVVERRERQGEIALSLLSLPRDPDSAEDAREANIVGTFLDAMGRHRPQLVGFNSRDSDLRILVQRGVILGLAAGGFADRPDKPWEDWNVDLKLEVGGFGKTVPSLHELAVQSGIPGKMGVDGDDVAGLWLAGRLREIVAYNEQDALTTYLVWLRIAHFSGLFSAEDYAGEQVLVRKLIERELGARPHLVRYLEEWDRLRTIVAQR